MAVCAHEDAGGVAVCAHDEDAGGGEAVCAHQDEDTGTILCTRSL